MAPSPWADTPFPLISLPGRGLDLSKAHESVYVAREMTFAHNGMIRSLNSIYQQCIYVSSPSDIADLLEYTQFWCDWIHEHHQGEETLFFPRIENITGSNGFMEKNVTQHHAFEPGLMELQRWVKDAKVESYDGMKLRGVIDDFGGKLTQHLTEEIQTLLELRIYDGPALKNTWNAFDLEMRKGDKVSSALMR
jgi:hemerythrin-like domain-containing protein